MEGGLEFGGALNPKLPAKCKVGAHSPQKQNYLRSWLHLVRRGLCANLKPFRDPGVPVRDYIRIILINTNL